MKIEGHWYPPQSSARQNAELTVNGEQFSLSIDGQRKESGFLDELSFSDRVGNIPRKIHFKSGAVFNTPENDEIDRLIADSRRIDSKDSVFSAILHNLETRWHWIVSALVIMVITVLLTVTYGLPWASEKMAQWMPMAVNEKISSATLDVLDRIMLDDSELEDKEQQRLREHFEAIVSKYNMGDYPYQFHFRSMMGVPNAFALPSGDIVITDALIEEADSQEEIDAVLFHEIGHVVHRHGMEQLVRGTFITIAITMIAGDATTIDESVIAFPVFLMESQYSREHEEEADEFAFEKMMDAGIDPIAFATIMEKIGEVQTSEHTSENGEPSERNGEKAKELTDYLSSHPVTESRIEKAKEYSKIYRERFK